MNLASNPFPDIFKPIVIGKRQSRNRVVAIPHGQSTLTAAELTNNLGEMARLSVGMIVVGGAVVDEASFRKRSQSLLPIYDRTFTDALAPAVEAVHQGGALLISQLLHLGVEMWPSVEANHAVWSPSSVPLLAHGGHSRAFDLKDLAALRAAHVTAAGNLAEVGFDGFEVHSAHNYLMHQFLMPRRNRRTDPYGGSLENRSRLIREVLGDVRDKVPEKILGIRLPAGGLPADGIEQSEILDLAEQLYSLRLVDYVTISVPSMPQRYVRDESFPPGGVRAFTRLLKSRISCPVNVTQRIDTPALAQDILASGDADLVGLGRPFLADQAWVQKAQQGRADEIRPCIRCLEDCRIFRPQRWVSCIVNPTALARPLPVPQPLTDKRVAVVGGGPAGCEAAMSAANAGASVTLFESGTELGGRLRLAGRAPYRETWHDYVRYLRRQVELHPAIDVKLNHTATARDIHAENPDFVVVAVGATQISDHEPSVSPVMTSDAFLSAKTMPDWQRVVIYDELGKWDAVNVAELMLAEGRKVVYVTPFERLANKVPEESRDFILDRLQKGGVELHLRSTLVNESNQWSVVDKWTGKRQILLPNDGIVHCGLLKPAPEPEGLDGSSLPTFRIGDGLTPRGLSLACREGATIASRLGA